MYVCMCIYVRVGGYPLHAESSFELDAFESSVYICVYIYVFHSICICIYSCVNMNMYRLYVHV